MKTTSVKRITTLCDIYLPKVESILEGCLIIGDESIFEIIPLQIAIAEQVSQSVESAHLRSSMPL